MKEKAVASAPGKVILFGEHFVVSGYPAIVTAIDMRARAVLTPSHDKFKIKSGQSWAAWNAEGEQIYPPPPQPTPFQPLFNMVLKIMEDH
ncbi:MAG: galactokinase family protein, partial [Candidatus Caldarchaeum sp.]